MTVIHDTTAALDQRTTDDRKRILERFPQNRRAYVANTVLFAVRAGAKNPLQVLVDVNKTLTGALERARRWNNQSGIIERTEQVYIILHEHHEEAMDLCRWALWWESLPQAERDRQKAARGAEHRQAYMESQPASEKQVAYIRALGFAGEVTSKAHASELIDQLRGGNRGN